MSLTCSRYSGSYNINLQFTTGRCGRPLGCGEIVLQTIPDAAVVLPPAEEDAYTFRGTAGESVTISVLQSSGLIRPRADLYDPTGRPIFGAVVINGSITVVLPVTGTYTIIVRDDDLRDGGTYTIRYERVGGCPVPAVTLAPASLDFGEQELGTPSAAQIVTVSSSGSAALTITSITATGDYAVVSDLCAATTLAPGVSCTFGVVFTPTAEGPRPGEVSIGSNAAGSPHLVGLGGTGVRRALTVTPAALAFGDQEVGISSAAQGVSISNSGSAAVTITSVTTTGDYAIVGDLWIAPIKTGEVS
jgi:DUF971 family protein